MAERCSRRTSREFMNLELLEFEVSIHRLSRDHMVPPALREEPFFAVVVAEHETTVVCPSAVALHSREVETGWRVLRVVGPIELSVIGVLAGIAQVLAAAKVSLFAVSTFETDYLLVRQVDLPVARNALQTNGFQFVS